MLNIESFLKELEKMSLTLPRNEFIPNIKKLEAEVMETLKKETLGQWSPGKGLSISKLLSDWRDEVIQKVIAYLGGIKKELSICAVGGYGRAELSPFSDMDILVIQKKNKENTGFIEEFIRILWDIGYKLGNSVRTLEQIEKDSAEDLFFLTSLFEIRLIAGDTELFQHIGASIKKSLLKTKKSCLQTMIRETHFILRENADEILSKEPNLKSSAGGLRSVHMMEWINYAFYSQSGLKGLKTFFSPIEYKRLYYNYDFILFIRNMQHFTHGRKEDTFYIDQQMMASSYLCLNGPDQETKMRKLMKKYYEKATEILISLIFVMDHFGSLFLKKKKKVLVKNKFYLLGNQLFIQDNLEISVTNAFEAILLCAEKNYSYSYNLISYLKKSAGKTKTLIYSYEIAVYLQKILSLPRSYYALNIMKISGLIYAYLTPLKPIKHYIIYNSFHQFTVDQHSIEAVKAIDDLFTIKIKNDASSDRAKFLLPMKIADLYSTHIWVVKLALLFHDAGKYYEGDHAKNGVEIAENFLKNYPIDFLFKKLILFLIEKHLLLSHIIRRSDIEDHHIMRDLAEELINSPFPREYMDLLFLITYADIYATNSKNYSGYLAELLNQVYMRASALIGQDEKIIPLKQEKDKNLNKLKKEILEKGFQIEVSLFNEYLKAKISAPDQKGLFSIFCGVLLINGADIVRARIETFEGTAIDEFIITGIFGEDFSKHRMRDELLLWEKDLIKSLPYYLENPKKLDEKIQELKISIKKTNDAFKRQTVVEYKQLPDNRSTFEISCTDRPALLYNIAHYFAQNGLSIQKAVIDTAGWYVHDLFEVKDSLSSKELNLFLEDLKSLIEKF
jgi:[protein-PII] uridylyltransferase